MIKTYAKKNGTMGFSVVEILITLAMVAILSAFAIPSLSSAMRDMQLMADSQNISSALNYARLRAKSLMNPYRVEFDLDNNQWSIRKYNSGSGNWDLEQDINELSTGVAGSGITFQNKSGSSPTGFPNESSSAVTFNSRGIPVNGLAPTQDNIIFISKSDTHYAVTANMTGKVQVWRQNDDGWCSN